MRKEQMRIKKFMTAALITAMTLSMSMVTFAATPGINTEEQAILDTLKGKVPTEAISSVRTYFTGIELSSAQAATIKLQIAEAQKTLDSVASAEALSSAQVQSIIKNIDTAAKTIDADLKATVDVSNPNACQYSLVNKNTGATVLSGTFVRSNPSDTTDNDDSDDDDTDDSTTVTNQKVNNNTNTVLPGTTVTTPAISAVTNEVQDNNAAGTSTNGVIKATGSDITMTYVVLAGMTVLLAGCGIVVMKKKNIVEV